LRQEGSITTSMQGGRRGEQLQGYWGGRNFTQPASLSNFKRGRRRETTTTGKGGEEFFAKKKKNKEGKTKRRRNTSNRETFSLYTSLHGLADGCDHAKGRKGILT